MEVKPVMKILHLQHCCECPLKYTLDTGGVFCEETDTCIDDYVGFYVGTPSFPPDCPLDDATK